MADRRDDQPLLVGRLALGGLAHEVVELEVRRQRDVVERRVPEPGHVDAHVVVIERALVPRRIVRRALNHAAAGRHGHRVGEDALRSASALMMSCSGRCQ